MNEIKKEHILSAIKEIKEKPSLRNGRSSNIWDLFHDGEDYPPKLVISIANRYATGTELGPNDFLGGDNQPSFKLLRDYGFKLVQKKNSIAALLQKYKAHIKTTELKDELYKWEFISQFQGRPDLKATDLLQEVKSIKYGNLMYAMAQAVLYHLIQARPEEMRVLLTDLFDEEKDITQRIKDYSTKSLALYRGIGETLQHHQDERTIAALLTVQKPEKYTFYKNSFYKKLCKLLKVAEAPKNEKYSHYLSLINSIIEDHIGKDEELINMAKSFIPEYDGSNHLLLAQDFLYQMLDKEQPAQQRYWLYAPGENANKWDEFFDAGIMGLGWNRLGDLNDYSSKEEIAAKLRELENAEGSKNNDAMANYDFKETISVGDIIIAKKGRREYVGYGIVTSDYYYDDTRSDYQKCRKVDWKKKGVWKEDGTDIVLKTLTDITKYPEYVEKLIELIGIGTTETITNSTSDYRAPINQILYGPPGTGKTYNTVLEAAKIVSGRTGLTFDEALEIFNKNLKDQIEFITFHQNFSYEDFIQGLRPDITQNNHLSFERKDGIFKSIADRALKNLELAAKAPEELSNEARFDKALEDFKDSILDVEDKYAINDAVHIFEIDDDAFRYTGANWESHATGIRMKFSDLKEFYRNNIRTRKDIKTLTTVSGVARQHATYYLLVYQAILKFLPIKAAQTVKVEKKNYVIVIDEINRANISRVFGELITLIEEDKRSGGKIPMRVTLPSGDNFIVPSNLYIIGTMNTADKSIALLDIALRRRFEFVPMYPKYAIEGQNIYYPEVLKAINEKICKLKTRDFQIGHAYFMENDNLEHILNRKVIPLLLEYFMNDEKTVKDIISIPNCTVDTDQWPMKFSQN